jgi:DNA-binding LacI/PurR family transcriptional regulator
MSSNIKDVANLAGVSISTVSNVLSGKKGVSDNLRQRVLSACEELNYKTNPIASGLRGSKTHSIGVIITSLDCIFFTQIVKGIQDAANSVGYDVSIYQSESVLDKEKQCINNLLKNQTDGIILRTCANTANDDELKYLLDLSKLKVKDKKVPVVLLESGLSDSNFDAVCVNNFRAAYDAVDYLIKRGHKKIAHIEGPLGIEMCRQRKEGYNKALLDNSISFNPEIVKQGDFSPISGYSCMREIMQNSEITAVFASNDQMAIGAIKAIKDIGKQIPEDIAVVGFDNLFISSITSPTLSTVHVPKYQMGKESFEMVYQNIINNVFGEGKIKVLNSNLIIRQSTDLRGESNWDLLGW